MIKTGLEVGTLADEVGLEPLLENRLSFEFRTWSRSFRSSFADMSSAAPPFGHRMIGIDPVARLSLVQDSRKQHTHCNGYAEKPADHPVK